MRFNPDEYVSVAERIFRFYEKFSEGRILTTIVEHIREDGFILIRAEVYREPDDALPAATGHAYELRSSGQAQQGSYIEVCETSAVGRALVNLGFSANANQAPAVAPAPKRIIKPEQPLVAGSTVAKATDGQLDEIRKLADECIVNSEEACKATFGADSLLDKLNIQGADYLLAVLKKKARQQKEVKK